jgi:hypothetical protein
VDRVFNQWKKKKKKKKEEEEEEEKLFSKGSLPTVQ